MMDNTLNEISLADIQEVSAALGMEIFKGIVRERRMREMAAQIKELTPEPVPDFDPADMMYTVDQ